MMLKRGAVQIAMALLIITASAHAANIHDGAGTTGTPFLKIEGGSRPAGLGGAFVGLANDINTIFWNPAGLTAIHDRELTAMQHFSFADINNQTIGYAQRVERLVWGASFLGGFTEYERRQHGPTSEPDSTPTVGAFATGLSFAYPLGTAMSVGGTAKLISEQWDIQSGYGVAADVGLILHLLDNHLGIGVAVQNAGVLSGGINPPMALRAGLAYRIWKQEEETDKPMPPQELWALVADAHLPLLDANPSFHIGVERWFYESIAARAGYRIGLNQNPSDGLALGIGVRRSGEDMLANIDFQFDYAFVPDAYVGNAHRVSFITRF